jgi:hypothetical protein
MSASAHIARAKKAGVEYEQFADSEILERDGYVCQECEEPCDRSKIAPHPRAPTLGHIIAIGCGGPHTRANTRCECWSCNEELNHTRDTPKAAKIKRQRGDTGQQARRARRKAEGKKPLLEGRGFDKSLSKKMNGEVIRNG